MKTALETALAFRKPRQTARYSTLGLDFKHIYDSISKYVDSDYVIPFWKNIDKELAQEFDGCPPFDFLNNSHICNTMFTLNTDWANVQLDILEKNFTTGFLTRVLEENLIGNPPIFNEKYFTSCNNVHHLYHYWRYVNHKGWENTQAEGSVVEWGGGYGHMALMFKLMFPNPYQTYTIIDLPIFSTLQWLYLSCIRSEDAVHLIMDEKSEIKPGKINLLPIGLLDVYKDYLMGQDMFVAMWSLSESSPKACDLMLNTNFLRSKNAMMGFHGHRDETMPSGNILFEYARHFMTIEKTGMIDNHYYAWR